MVTSKLGWTWPRAGGPSHRAQGTACVCLLVRRLGAGVGGMGGHCSDVCWKRRGTRGAPCPGRGGDGFLHPCWVGSLPMSGHPLASPPPTAGSLCDAPGPLASLSMTRWQRVSLSLNSPRGPCCWDSHSEPRGSARVFVQFCKHVSADGFPGGPVVADLPPMQVTRRQPLLRGDCTCSRAVNTCATADTCAPRAHAG